MIAGICIAVYDSSIRYASQRSQFNRPISGTSSLPRFSAYPIKTGQNNVPHTGSPFYLCASIQTNADRWTEYGESRTCERLGLWTGERDKPLGKVDLWRKRPFAWELLNESLGWFGGDLYICRDKLVGLRRCRKKTLWLSDGWIALQWWLVSAEWMSQVSMNSVLAQSTKLECKKIINHFFYPK